MNRIILCMIVKNEAHIMERCLNHALTVIDAACICDTGSTDGTPEVVEDLLERAGIPHRVCRHEWVNFGANRTRSFAETRRLAQELGWDLTRTYALFLDADFIVRAAESFDVSQLTAGGYSIQWRSGALVYRNTGLARLDLDWRSIGAAHEYWSAEGLNTTELLDSLWIEHVGDGGHGSGDKNERNLRLLEADLREQPDSSRTLFYLAQTYFDMGRFEEAREHYLRRIEVGGWEEETWFAAYRAAVCLAHLEHWEGALSELLAAWERRPWRAEPLYMLAHFARQRGQWQTAVMAAEQALKIVFPRDDRLFVNFRAYREGPIEELSIAAYYAGMHERGAAACDALLHHRATTASSRNLAARNSSHYGTLLAARDIQRVVIPPELCPAPFTSSTGSICRTPNGYALVNRLLNYYIESSNHFLSRDPDGRFRTRNVWVEFDRDLNQLSATPINDELNDAVAVIPNAEALVSGIEDLRLFRWRDAWWFSANSRQFDAQMQWRTVLGRLDEHGTTVEHLVPLQYASSTSTEKNWVPLIHGDRLLLVYSRDPLVLLEPDPETGECQEVQRSLPPVDLSRYRGSTPMIRIGDRYLGIVHEFVYSDNRRTYQHRFIEMDRDLHVTRASRLFRFRHRGVEYTCGMCPSHDEGELIISFSVQERESWLARVPISRVDELLIPIDHLAFLDPPTEEGPGWLDLTGPAGESSTNAGVQPNGSTPRVRRARRPLRRLLARPRRPARARD